MCVCVWELWTVQMREREGEKRWNEKLGVPSPAAALLLRRIDYTHRWWWCVGTRKSLPQLSHTSSVLIFFYFFFNLWAQVNTWASKVLRYLYPGFDITRAKFIVSIIRRLPNPSHRRLCVQTIRVRDKTSWKSSLTQRPQPHQKTKKDLWYARIGWRRRILIIIIIAGLSII
jgi:hypothetical protein